MRAFFMFIGGLLFIYGLLSVTTAIAFKEPLSDKGKLIFKEQDTADLGITELRFEEIRRQRIEEEKKQDTADLQKSYPFPVKWKEFRQQSVEEKRKQDTVDLQKSYLWFP